MSGLRFRSKDLRGFVAAALAGVGVTAAEAALVADVLVDAEERSYSSQGLMRLPSYLRWAREGALRSPAHVVLKRESPSAIALEGNHGWGAVVTTQAMAMCVERARATGCCVAAVSDVGHVGRLGYYVERAAEEGMIGIVALSGSISSPVMAPWGGREPRLSTNPIAFGFPNPGAAPVVTDISTTQAARGKVVVAASTGQPIPDTWAFDVEGNPTTDPASALPPAGTLAPLGGHKGYALAVVVELLSAGLAGEYPREGDSMFVAAIDIAAVTEARLFDGAVRALEASVRSSSPRPGHDQPLLPGAGGAARKAKAMLEGVVVAEEIWRQVSEAAAGLAVPAPRPL